MSQPSDWWKSLPTTSFGSSHMEERLAGLIIAGRKRATVWNGQEENPTRPGMDWVVTAIGKPVAIIKTLSVGQCRFDEIDANFAYKRVKAIEASLTGAQCIRPSLRRRQILHPTWSCGGRSFAWLRF